MVTKQRGSAIIVAVLLISAIGAVGFSFGRVFLSQFANATVRENGVFAYYAAESGIEEGFLRYRYSRDVEVPFASWTMNATGRKMFSRTDLTTPARLDNVDKTTSVVPTLNDQYYYLRMGYAGTGGLPFFGQNPSTVGAPEVLLTKEDIADSSYGTADKIYLKIARDDSYKIDLTNVMDSIGNDVNLFAKFIGKSLTDKAIIGNSFMEAKLIFEINSNTIKEYKTILSANPDTTCLDLQTTGVLGCAASAVSANPITPSNSNDYAWSISNLVSTWRTQASPNMMASTADFKVTLVLKPLYHDAVIGISSNQCGTVGGSCDYTANTVVPGPFTTVSSVGTYKGVYRTLEANIDRQSGSLYDLYDYVIYKATP
jgi:hypothetical protein